MNQQPIFIFGKGRSGTTLLTMILNAHSQIAIAPEAHYFDKFWRKYQRYNSFQNKSKYIKFVNYLFNSQEIKVFGFSPEETKKLVNKILSEPQSSHRIVLENILFCYAAKQGKPIWGQQTPGDIEVVARILKVFPQARIIQIIRDPRDIILSLRKVPWGRKGNMIEHLKQWKRCVRLSEHNKCLNQQNYFEIKYETLLVGTEETVSKICSFVGAAFEPQMLQHHKKAEPIFSLSGEPWKAKALGQIDPDNLANWKGQLTPEELQLISRLVGRELIGKGYECTEQRLRVKLALLLIKLHSENLYLKLKHYSRRLRDKLKGRY